MTEKQKKILEALSQHNDDYMSGQSLARMFSCSRASIWKNISSLREKGYPIEALTHRGYRLMNSQKEMECNIRNGLSQAEVHFDFDVHVLDSTDSTNNIVREEGRAGKSEGYVCVARTQKQGRGRQGKEWISGTTDGLWFSLLLRPDILPEYTGLLSLYFAWVVSCAIRACGLDHVAVKWPNDIVSLKSGKKMCGILSEASFEDDRLIFAIIGCGVNVSHEVFPHCIEKIATSLKMEGLKVSTSDLLVAILAQLSISYPYFKIDPRTFIDRYKKECVTIGRDVIVHAEEQLIGKAIDISEKGALIVDMKDRTQRTFFAGEVSVRGLMGYV